MATITYYLPKPDSNASVTSETSTAIVATDPALGVVGTYSGTGFTFASDGSLTGGTLTGFTQTLHGDLVTQITGMNTPFVPVAQALLSDNDATANNLMFGGADSFQGSLYNDSVMAGPGNDTVIALDGNDTIDGGDGNDDINGNKGADIVNGGPGNDTVRGGQDNDTVLGGDGDDGHVNGNIGNDIVHGGNGNDTVYGGQGADTVFGDAGDDLLSGDLGADILFGGPGADRFTIAKGGGADWVSDFNGVEGDRIQLAPGTAYTVTSYQNQVVIDLGGGDQIGLAGITPANFNASWIVFG